MAEKEMICPDNWKDIFRKFTFVPAVKKEGKVIALSGLTGVNYETGELVGEGDIVAQTRQIFENIKQILQAANASITDIIQTTDYITTTEGYKETAQVRREYFGDNFPASTGVIVAGLLRPKALIEISAIAIVDD